MIVIKSPQQMQAYSLAQRNLKKRIGLVPTMGALHAGHAKLIQVARKENDLVIVSIFVNPTQFGPKEDFRKYPRTFQKDLNVCKSSGADVVFAPSVQSMYPDGFCTYITVGKMGDVLCGLSRPGHFRGVATVVAKLLNSTIPARAYFGQKDAQQVVIIKRFVEDLNFPVSVRVVPIVRHADGLAMSSRNAYLNSAQRNDAVILSQSLMVARTLIRCGERNAVSIKNAIRRLIARVRRARIDYVEIVNAATLVPLQKISGKTLIVLAVYIGSTRLIDNIVIEGK